MAKLLHVEGSPRNNRSRATRLATEFLSTYQAKNSGDEIEVLNVWDKPLPDFNGDMLAAKYAVMNAEDLTQDQADAWESVRVIFEQFNSADKYFFTVPMWNFGIPYRLKQYIDILTQPGLAWSYSPEESYNGLLENKSSVVLYTRGDRYGEGTGFETFDLQKPYFNLWLNFIGISDIVELILDGTLFADEDNTEEKVMQQVVKAASEF